MRTIYLAVAVALAAAGVGAEAAAAPNAAVAFAPEVFFAGRTRSSGTTEDVFGDPTGRISGETRGRRQQDGSTLLEQTIRAENGGTRTRSWRIVRTGPGTIEATGSDVVGKATGEIQGRTMRFVSTIRWAPGVPLGNLELDQTFELQADGRTVLNRSTVSRDGVVVQKIDETIVHQ